MLRYIFYLGKNNGNNTYWCVNSWVQKPLNCFHCMWKLFSTRDNPMPGAFLHTMDMLSLSISLCRFSLVHFSVSCCVRAEWSDKERIMFLAWAWWFHTTDAEAPSLPVASCFGSLLSWLLHRLHPPYLRTWNSAYTHVMWMWYDTYCRDVNMAWMKNWKVPINCLHFFSDYWTD